MSEVGVNDFPAYCNNCKKMFTVNLNEEHHQCNHCQSENVRLYGQGTRDPNSIIIPTEADLRDEARREEEKYAQLRDQYRIEDEESIRSDIEEAKETVKGILEEGGGMLEFVDIFRETADLTEEHIQKLIEDRSSQTYWQRHSYKDAEDWIRRSLEMKPNWYDGRHICPQCHEHELTFKVRMYFD